MTTRDFRIAAIALSHASVELVTVNLLAGESRHRSLTLPDGELQAARSLRARFEQLDWEGVELAYVEDSTGHAFFLQGAVAAAIPKSVSNVLPAGATWRSVFTGTELVNERALIMRCLDHGFDPASAPLAAFNAFAIAWAMRHELRQGNATAARFATHDLADDLTAAPPA